jgi:hypothetical protein
MFLDMCELFFPLMERIYGYVFVPSGFKKKLFFIVCVSHNFDKIYAPW